MNLTEALKELNSGKKIRRKSWRKHYWYQVKNGYLYTSENQVFHLVLSLNDINADDWEVKKCDPSLTDKEKRYLENLLHPFIKDYNIFLKKHLTTGNTYTIEITLISDDSVNADDYFELPSFSKYTPMYRGLEEDYSYTTYDLKLFKE